MENDLITTLTEMKTILKQLTTDIEALKTTVDMIKERGYAGAVETENMKNRLVNVETWVSEHKSQHIRDIDNRRGINWQLWFLIISIAVGGVAGWIIALMQGTG